MIRVTVELISAVSPERNRILGKLEIANDGTGTADVGNYTGVLHAEYTPTNGRRGKVTGFNRKGQSTWSLIGAFLKLFGHTKHSPKLMAESTRPADDLFSQPVNPLDS